MNYTTDTKLKDVTSNVNDLEGFLCFKAKHHAHYRKYLTLDIAENLIAEGYITFSSGKKWNDKDDKSNVKEEELYTLCLSYSTLEDVAMWMLYGGMGKDGGMIDFTQKQIKNLLTANKAWLCKKEGKELDDIQAIDICESNFEICDVIYCNEQENGLYTIKRSDYRQKDVSEDVIDSLKHYIKKQYEWNYENEVRIILHIDKSILNDKAKDCDFIKIYFKDCNDKFGDIRSYYAPNYRDTKKILGNSKLTGKIEWDLCENYKCKRGNK